MRKIILLFIIFSSIFSCTIMPEHKDSFGTINGILTDLGNGKYGIDGIASSSKLFELDRKVKYTLYTDSAPLVLGLYNVGDNIQFLFGYVSIGEGDWNTIISVYQ